MCGGSVLTMGVQLAITKILTWKLASYHAQTLRLKRSKIQPAHLLIGGSIKADESGFKDDLEAFQKMLLV